MSQATTAAKMPSLVTLFLLLGLLPMLGAQAGTKLDPNICATVGGNANYRYGFSEWRPGAAGRPMLRHTLTGVNARCNDGSPAVMYLRPAPAGSADADKWVIHFEGGGGCRNGDDCLARWCGTTTRSFDQAGKMSSLGAPEGLADQGGILNQVAGGPFSRYNQVLLSYCSSDNWIGSASIGEPVDPVTGLPPTYDIEFQGENIVADAIATLRASPTFADAVAAARYGAITMPDLDSATRIILSGDSAGGGGARHHADAIRDLWQPGGVPDVLLAVNAGFTPALYDPVVVPNWAVIVPTSGLPYTDYFDYMRREYEAPSRGFWGVNDSALDQSCLSSAPNPPYHCLDSDWVLENHITTPFFIAQDLTDPMPLPNYLAMGIFANAFDFAVASADLLNRVVNPGTLVGPAAWPAAGMGEPRSVVPGVLGIHCSNHVMLRETAKFRNWEITPVAAASPLETLLDDWVNGGSVLQIQTDNPAVAGYNRSFCP